MDRQDAIETALTYELNRVKEELSELEEEREKLQEKRDNHKKREKHYKKKISESDIQNVRNELSDVSDEMKSSINAMNAVVQNIDSPQAHAVDFTKIQRVISDFIKPSTNQIVVTSIDEVEDNIQKFTKEYRKINRNIAHIQAEKDELNVDIDDALDIGNYSDVLYKIVEFLEMYKKQLKEEVAYTENETKLGTTDRTEKRLRTDLEKRKERLDEYLE